MRFKSQCHGFLMTSCLEQKYFETREKVRRSLECSNACADLMILVVVSFPPSQAEEFLLKYLGAKYHLDLLKPDTLPLH